MYCGHPLVFRVTAFTDIKTAIMKLFLTHGMSIAAILEVWHRCTHKLKAVRYARKEPLILVHQKSKNLLSIQSKHEITYLKIQYVVDNNLSDERSHKVQYIDPIIGYFHVNFVSMDDP